MWNWFFGRFQRIETKLDILIAQNEDIKTKLDKIDREVGDGGGFDDETKWVILIAALEEIQSRVDWLVDRTDSDALKKLKERIQHEYIIRYIGHLESSSANIWNGGIKK